MHGVGHFLGIATLVQANGSDPAANSESSTTVPAGQHWGLLAVSVALAQGATQTPQPIIVIDDGTDVIFESFGSSAAQAVNTTCRYTWGVGLPLSGQVGATTDVHSLAPLPEGLLLAPGYRIRTSTIGKGANTDLAAPSLFYVQYGS